MVVKKVVAMVAKKAVKTAEKGERQVALWVELMAILMDMNSTDSLMAEMKV